MSAGGTGGGDDERLPIKLDTATNGEFAPVPLGPELVLARTLAHKHAARNAARLGLSRRAFLSSACGAASTLLAMNQAFARAGPRGGFFELEAESALEPALAQARVGGDEFIFDIQGHHVNPNGRWRESAPHWGEILERFPQSHCGDRWLRSVDCFSARHFVREVFLESDTDMAVLSFVPAQPHEAPLTIEEADATRTLVDALEGTERLLLHGPVHPNFPGELDRMQELAERFGVSAWKTYTQFGPEGRGYSLDDEKFGLPFIERARATGIPRICVHKGFPFVGMDAAHTDCRDIGVVARRHPDVTFIVYHSGFETRTREGPYRGGARPRGIDSLIRSLEENGVAPNSNVYAELGSTWRFLMRDPDAAAHALGKLLRYVGEERVVWGTDSIWYGSPQDQIQAFRTFQIAEDLREKHGYPKLTPALRARVFGLNAAVAYGIDPTHAKRRAGSDVVTASRNVYREAPAPTFWTYGPKTRREFLRYLRSGGLPKATALP